MNETVAVTSGTRGTGKSTSTVALGHLLANAGHDVLLVDCDFDDPSLADHLDLENSAVTIQDVLVGNATVRDAVHEVSDGVSVVPASKSESPEPALIAAYVRTLDDFDVVICDTGHPFDDVTTGALDAADGVLVVSTPDAAARRNTATLHKTLRKRGDPSMIGTVLTRVREESADADWDCDVLTSIPESDALLTHRRALCGSRDPASVAYRDLANEVHRWIDPGAGDDSELKNREIWLPPPTDSFVTPGVSPQAGEDRDSNVSAVSDGGDRPSTGESAGTNSPVDASSSTPESESSDSTAADEDDEGDDGGFVLTRRGALTAAAAAVGGVSAGVLNTRERPDFDAFGYGGAPIPSNESSTDAAANDTTNAGGAPVAGVDRTDLTTAAEATSDTGEQVANGTDTGSGNGTSTDEDPNLDTESETKEQTETDSESDAETPTGTGSGSETGTEGSGSGGDGGSDAGTGGSSGSGTEGTGDSRSGGVDDDTGDSGGTDDGTESGSGSDGGTGDSGGTDDGTESGSGSDDGTGDGGGTDDGTESGDGTDNGTGSSGGDETDDGTESGDGTDDGTSSPGPEDEPYGTVGYGQGGYGGVA